MYSSVLLQSLRTQEANRDGNQERKTEVFVGGSRSNLEYETRKDIG